MRINESGISIERSGITLETLSQLKDGQKIVAKILSSTESEVLLKVGGEQIRAKVEGTPPAIGSVFVFGLRKVTHDRIELKPLANLSDGQAEPELFPTDHLLAKVLKEQGLPVTKENMGALNRLLSDLQLKFQLFPDLKWAAFMVARQMPPSVGGFLIAWLHNDQKLRENLWNHLDQSGGLNPEVMVDPGQTSADILRSLLDLWKNTLIKPKTNGFSEATSLLNRNVGIPLGNHVGDQLHAGEGQSEVGDKLKTIADLLTDHATWSEAPVPGNNFSQTDYSALPFLVRMSDGKLRECIVHWKQPKVTGVISSEQTIRVAIPTNNLGDITLEIRLNPHPALVNLEVESEMVRSFLATQTEAFQKIVGPGVRVRIEALHPETELAEGVDLWM